MVYSKHCFAPRKAHTYPIELSVVKNCSKCACGSIAVLGSGVRALSKLTDSFTCSNGKTCPRLVKCEETSDSSDEVTYRKQHFHTN